MANYWRMEWYAANWKCCQPTPLGTDRPFCSFQMVSFSCTLSCIPFIFICLEKCRRKNVHGNTNCHHRAIYLIYFYSIIIIVIIAWCRRWCWPMCMSIISTIAVIICNYSARKATRKMRQSADGVAVCARASHTNHMCEGKELSKREHQYTLAVCGGGCCRIMRIGRKRPSSERGPIENKEKKTSKMLKRLFYNMLRG